MSDEQVDEDKRATLRQFAAFGAVSSLARFRSVEGESDARGAILGYLSATPGAHFSKVRDDLHLGTGEAQHHLRRLIEQGAVESRRDGDYRRFFPAERFSPFEQDVLGWLRRETPRGMLVHLLRDPDATGRDLSERLGVSRPAVSKHAADLERTGLLSRTDGYRIEHPETVLLLLVRYANSFGEDAAALATEADTFVRYDPPD